MDPASLGFLLGLAPVGVLLVMSGFFSSAETAIFSLTKVQVQRLREDDTLVNRKIVQFVDNPNRLLITSLLGNIFINIAFVTLMTSMALSLGKALAWSQGATLAGSMVVTTVVLLIFGEIAPKTFAIRNAERVARLIAVPLWGTAVALTPLRRVMRAIVDAVGRALGSADDADAVTEAEIRDVVSTGEAEGSIEEGERELIHRIFELRELMAKDVMVPRTEMVCVETDQIVRDVLALAESVGHSRLPVYAGHVDNIVGVFHVKDMPQWYGSDIGDVTLESLISQGGSTTAQGTLIRPPLFLPDTRRLDALLLDLSNEGTQMATLLDEYGGTAGIVTLEDIVEEIVGEILDEYDEQAEPELGSELDLDTLRRDGVDFPAKTTLKTAGRLLGVAFDVESGDTLGGYVYTLFGRLPSVGESVADEHGFDFEVTRMSGTRIQNIIVKRQEESDHAATPEDPA